MTSVQVNGAQPGSHVMVRAEEPATLGRLGLTAWYFDGIVNSPSLVVPVLVGTRIAVQVTDPDGDTVVYHVGPFREGEYEVIEPWDTTRLSLRDIVVPDSVLYVAAGDEVLYNGQPAESTLVLTVPSGVPLTIRCLHEAYLPFEMVDLVLQGDECHLSMTSSPDYNFRDWSQVPEPSWVSGTGSKEGVIKTAPVPTGKRDIRL